MVHFFRGEIGWVFQQVFKTRVHADYYVGPAIFLDEKWASVQRQIAHSRIMAFSEATGKLA
jgi:hypothetical protein